MDEKAVSKPRKEMVSMAAQASNLTLLTAFRSRPMIIVLITFFLLVFCNQMIMVHLVNFATDIEISPFIAASLISIIGVVSIGGRLTIGIGSDKIGSLNALLFCCSLMLISYVFLVFTNTLWMLYIFTVIFGLAYGAEIPQIPLLIGQFCGTRSMAALVGLVLFIGNVGGSLGSIVAGRIFDLTLSYYYAFIMGAVVSLLAVGMSLLLRKYKPSDAQG